MNRFGNTDLQCDAPSRERAEHPDCGKRGIRTPGALQLNGFQDRRNRPLCHLSADKNNIVFSFLQIIINGYGAESHRETGKHFHLFTEYPFGSEEHRKKSKDSISGRTTLRRQKHLVKKSLTFVK